MHSSWFSYNISKPYPFNWFTPVVLVGGIIFTVLFSVINLAANGYYLTSIYTTSPNTTISTEYWFNKAPWSWGDKLKPTCQAQNIPIGYSFFTTNLGLSYTLKSVTQYDPKANETIHLPSLPYLNQTLQDCEIDSVILYTKKSDVSENGNGAWWSWGDSTGGATAHCTISTAVGPVDATFSTTYDTSAKQFDYVIQNSYKNTSSMWWGTRLLNLYWSSTLYEMSYMQFPDEENKNWTATPIYTKGQITFTPNKTNDVKAYDFFRMQFYFLAGDGQIRNYVYDDLSIMYNNLDNIAYSGPLTEGLSWAKIMYSMILVDLGQSRSQNLLLNQDLLQGMLQYPDDKVRQSLDPYSCDDQNICYQDWKNFGAIAAPNDVPDSAIQKPMNQSYEAYKSMMGPLGTKSTTVFSQYSCSVPIKKSTGSLFLAVLIADLVFLQVMWTLLNVVAGIIVAKRHPDAMACHPHGQATAYDMAGGATPFGGYSKVGDNQSKLTNNSTHDVSSSGSLLEMPHFR